MNIKTKKKNADGIVRLETSGEIKEVLFKEDFLKPKEAGIAICFRGKDSSGIIEMSPREMEAIIHDFTGKMDLLKGAKVMKFEK